MLENNTVKLKCHNQILNHCPVGNMPALHANMKEACGRRSDVSLVKNHFEGRRGNGDLLDLSRLTREVLTGDLPLRLTAEVRSGKQRAREHTPPGGG